MFSFYFDKVSRQKSQSWLLSWTLATYSSWFCWFSPLSFANMIMFTVYSCWNCRWSSVESFLSSWEYKFPHRETTLGFFRNGDSSEKISKPSSSLKSCISTIKHYVRTKNVRDLIFLSFLTNIFIIFDIYPYLSLCFYIVFE